MVRRAQGPLISAARELGTTREKPEKRVFTETIHFRSNVYGLVGEYEAYRVLSGVVHGDAGGLLGLTKKTASGMIHRLGPDLSLALLALLYGFRWLTKFAEAVEVAHPFPAVVDLRRSTEELVNLFPHLVVTCRRVDNLVWPVSARRYLLSRPSTVLMPRKSGGSFTTCISEG